jgi:phosphoribosylglycinamide formyltransferase-1
MQALVEGGTGLEYRAVISNRPDAKGLEWARSRGIATRLLDHKAFAGRDAFDAALAPVIEGFAPDLIFLAGYMRIMGSAFVDRFRGRMVNIHPSLLPSFPGLHTHRRALEAGVKVHGATVHFVTPTLDNGPIIIQAAVPVLPGDDEGALSRRVLAQEHRIYPQAARWLAEGKVEFPANGVVQLPGSGVDSDILISPRVPP